jgi:hypothetical protein
MGKLRFLCNATALSASLKGIQGKLFSRFERGLGIAREANPKKESSSAAKAL